MLVQHHLTLLNATLYGPRLNSSMLGNVRSLMLEDVRSSLTSPKASFKQVPRRPKYYLKNEIIFSF